MSNTANVVVSTHVHVGNEAGPRVQLCWKESPAMVHCDRATRHEGKHSWECSKD